MSEALLPERFLFRFSVPCHYRKPLWTSAGAGLDDRYALVGLAGREQRPGSGTSEAAWSEEGLVVVVQVTGKKQPPWCRSSRPEDSDCVQIWIDTRDVHNVHRASRFCQRLIFLPTGGGRKSDEPVGQTLPINRTREPARPVADGVLKARSEVSANGYILEAFIPAEALIGFDPVEHPRLGFTYAVIDRELGEQTLGVGSPLPYQEDPSLWPTLELVSPA